MVVSNIVYFHPYLGKIPILTAIFQLGWNHQLDKRLALRFQAVLWKTFQTPWIRHMGPETVNHRVLSAEIWRWFPCHTFYHSLSYFLRRTLVASNGEKIGVENGWGDSYMVGWWQLSYFLFHPYLGKIPILTAIFQRGWNHQLVMVGLYKGLYYSVI